MSYHAWKTKVQRRPPRADDDTAAHSGRASNLPSPDCVWWTWAVVWHSVPAMGLGALIRALDPRPASNLVIVTVILFIILDGGAHAALSGFTPMCTRASQRTQRLSFAGSLQGKIMFSSWPSSSGLRPSKGPVWPDSLVRRLSLKPSVLAHSPASGICHFVQPVSSPATLAIHARVPAR